MVLGIARFWMAVPGGNPEPSSRRGPVSGEAVLESGASTVCEFPRGLKMVLFFGLTSKYVMCWTAVVDDKTVQRVQWYQRLCLMKNHGLGQSSWGPQHLHYMSKKDFLSARVPSWGWVRSRNCSAPTRASSSDGEAKRLRSGGNWYKIFNLVDKALTMSHFPKFLCFRERILRPPLLRSAQSCLQRKHRSRYCLRRTVQVRDVSPNPALAINYNPSRTCKCH